LPKKQSEGVRFLLIR